MNPYAYGRGLRTVAGIAAAVLICLLNACSTTPPRATPQTRPPAPPLDINAIPDAIPKPEPYAKRGNPSVYEVFGNRYYTLRASKNFVERGLASWYGPNFHGKTTSNGEIYDMYAMTAAHKTLPLPTYVRVTNLNNQRSVVVRVNDRGPFVEDRIIDLSYTAAAKLDILGPGTAPVEVRAIDPQAQQTAPVRVAIPNTATPSSERLTYVQVGAFRNRSTAEQTQTRLKSVADSVHIHSNADQTNSDWYRVRVGPLITPDDADRIVATLIELGFNPLLVVE